MRFLKRLLAPREVRAALGVLDEAEHTLDSEAFKLVKRQIEEAILSSPQGFAHMIIQTGASPRQWLYSAIANIAGDLVESGQYHIYRGVLNPLGPGEGLLHVFDAAVDELVQLRVLDAAKAQTQKAAIRENIKGVG